MNKRGMNKSIFDKTDKQNNQSPEGKEPTKEYKAGPGRPVKHEEPTKKITVVFGESRFVEINEVCFDILKNHNEKLSMTELIRGITEAVLDSEIDLETATSEADINELVASTLERGQNVMKS